MARRYTTRIYGAPYGRDGERGGETTAPLTLARNTLASGQRLDCFALRDEAQTTAIRRFERHSMDVYEVEL
ncbi:MAG: hypothetical protein BWZ08_02308 [candidate division BRC1 bacterium ADurb.BinA292]|nr:MAG: hypothetical protein BWZ08_02308 [candidate division BRC1 bacterium ADurb.BinA292]